MKLIGLTGTMGSGKTTVAEMILDKYDLVDKACVNIAFADGVKIIACQLSGMYRQELDSYKTKIIPHLGITARELYQQVGDFGKSINPNIWVGSTIARVDQHINDGDVVVVSDVRYDNEAQAIKDRGGIIIEIRRPNELKVEGVSKNHSSEQGIDESLINYVMTNDDSLLSLRLFVDSDEFYDYIK